MSASSRTSSTASTPVTSPASSLPESPTLDRGIRNEFPRELCQGLPYEIYHSFDLWGISSNEDLEQEFSTLGSPYLLPKSSQIDITIGVELEMVLLKHFPIDHYTLVRQSLSILAHKLGATVPDLGPDWTAVPNLGAVFQVKSDATITCKSWERLGALATPLEVATPILRNGSWTWVIPATCKAISSLANPPSRVDTAVNGSTGLHVHIGIGRPYTLAELKRVSKAIILLEHRMDRNHPKHRIPTDPMGSCFRSCVGSLVFRGLTMPRILGLVDQCLTIEELLCTINGTGPDRKSFQRLYKYNLTAVQTYGTIEFRQAAGTTKGQRILDWIGCVIRFITMAIRTEDKVFSEWAQMGGAPPEVCRLFGAPSPAGYGRRSRLRASKRRIPMRFRLSRKKRHVYLSKRGV